MKGLKFILLVTPGRRWFVCKAHIYFKTTRFIHDCFESIITHCFVAGYFLHHLPGMFGRQIQGAEEHKCSNDKILWLTFH
jgi:hypothetical protein